MVEGRSWISSFDSIFITTAESNLTDKKNFPTNFKQDKPF